MANVDINELKTEKKRLELHFVYAAVIFTLFTAFLMSDRWTGKPDFTTYLTNIATFVSVVLGMVAIFYSFISNSSLSQSLGNISKVSDEVTLAKSEIENFLRHATELGQSGAANTASLREISTSVEKHIDLLNGALAEVTEKTKSLHSAVQVIPGKIDQLESRLAEANKPKDKPQEAEEPQAADVQAYQAQAVMNFLDWSSIQGRFLAYACVLAYESGKELSIKQIAPLISKGACAADYLYGFLVGMLSADLIDTTRKEFRIYVIERVDETMKHEVKDIIVSKLERKYKDSPEQLDKYLKVLVAMEEHFRAE